MNRAGRSLKAAVAAGALAFGGAGTVGLAATAAPASAATTTTTAQTVYVAASGGADSSTCGTSASPCATIGQGITNAAAGDTVSVGPGTYDEQVVVPKPLELVGHFATVDPKGATSGSGQSLDAAAIMVLGSASGSTVQGFRVHGALGEGILVMSAKDVTVRGNQVSGNDLGTPATTTYRECAPQGQVPGDCGEGIHLMSATDSTVVGNRVTDNSGGILVTDELGPATGNKVMWNYVAGNLWDCGITLPSHSTTAVSTTGQLQPAKGGVYGNRITHNRIIDNGVLGDGAGVLMAASAPGGASYDNFVGGNVLYGNGMAGVTIHSHAPQQDVSGNVVVWNRIGTNNVTGDPDANVKVTTGVVVFAAVPTATVTVTIAHNHITGNVQPTWTSPNVTVKG